MLGVFCYTIRMTTSSWARQRQLTYGGGILLFFFVVIAPIVFFTTYEVATCFDGIHNQNETTIDRGGECVLLDERFMQPHVVLWSRAFPVRDGFYNTVAYIENPNQGAGVFNAAYQFKLYDERNILITERFGRVAVLPGKVFPVFESRIDTGNRIPTRTFFSFVSDFQWERMAETLEGVSVINERLSTLGSSPRLDTVLRNSSVYIHEDIVIIATLFDAQGNAFASSRTLVEKLVPNEERDIAFTWPESFDDEVARIDIIPLALPVQN